jgi:two-component system alkaline phosphatase synthesis response regulator PhoP
MNKTSKGTILVVEDEEALQNTLRLSLTLEGYEVSVTSDGASALRKVREEYFDLMILDIMLPELDGISVCETIRLTNTELPILMLSARSGGSDRVLGLKKGADDYLTKPFHLEELLLRVEKLIKKNRKLQENPQIEDVFIFGGNRIDFNAQEAVNSHGDRIELSQREAMLLRLLISHRNEVVSREKILQSVWGYQVYPTTRTIDNFILNFRKYFEEDSRAPKYFHSVRGVGYRFADDQVS